MSKLLKKNGKLVKRGGKLVRSSNPATCECCRIIIDPCIGNPGGSIYGWNFDPKAPCEECFQECVKEDAPAWQFSEVDCNAHRETNCPPPPPVKYICAQRICEAGANYCNWTAVITGGVMYWEGGLQDCRNVGCAPGVFCKPPANPPTVEEYNDPLLNRIRTDCVSVTKECITEDEFDRGGWAKVSGPHDTLKDCEAACNPPPSCTGYCDWEWTGYAWQEGDITCKLPADCDCGPKPTRPGAFVDELVRVGCVPRTKGDNPLP